MLYPSRKKHRKSIRHVPIQRNNFSVSSMKLKKDDLIVQKTSHPPPTEITFNHRSNHIIKKQKKKS